MKEATDSSFPTKRLRFLTRRGLSEEQQQILANATQVTFLPMESIGEHGELDCSLTRDIDDVQNNYTQFFDGDVLVAKITPCFENGKGALVHGTLNGIGFGTTELHVLRPTAEIDARFLYYSTIGVPFRSGGEAAMFGAAGQKRVPESFVRNFHISIPSLSRQRTIADHLDSELTRLDALLSATNRVLALLAEKSQTLIVRTITTGLNPDVTFRHSSMSWYEFIPTHWEVWKLGHLARVGNGSTPNRSNTAYWSDGTIPWLNSSIVNQYEATRAEHFVTEHALNEYHLPIVTAGSVLVAITGQGKTRGRAVVLSFDATINQHIAYVTPDASRLDPWYLRWFFFSAYQFLRSISDDVGGTKGALTCEDLSNLLLPVPPLDEQRRIAAYIKSKYSRLETLRGTVAKYKKLLQERRSALVSGVVTGKIDVARAT